MVDIEIPQVVEMRELAADPAEIFPHIRQDGFDFSRRLFGERRSEIVAANPVFRPPWAESAHQPPAQMRGAVGVEQPHAAQQGNDQDAARRRDDFSRGRAQRRACDSKQAIH